MRTDALKAFQAMSPARFSASLEGLALSEALSGFSDDAHQENTSDAKQSNQSQVHLRVDSVVQLRTVMRNARFQDFIFGHALGSGAFATVFHARLREHGKSQSLYVSLKAFLDTSKCLLLPSQYSLIDCLVSPCRHRWPEVAAKQFSPGHVSGMRAEAAVLAGMMHPHVANLLNAFR